MTDNTEPTIDLYQKITDICFENGGATKPMVDKLYGLISDQVAKAKLEGFDVAFDCHDYDRLRAYRAEIAQLRSTQ